MTSILPRGVSYDQGRGRYVARLMIKGSAKYLGAFDTVDAAQAAYDGAVLVYGEPKRGVLSEAQLKRRDERYNEWLLSRVSLTDSLAPILPYDPGNPWPVVLTAVTLPDGEMFRLQRYDDRRTILGAAERVAVFTRRCREAGCKTLAETYLWLGPDRKWQHSAFDVCNEHMTPSEAKWRATSTHNYAMVLRAWDAVHASLGGDRQALELPWELEPEARRRANLLRPALRQLLEVVYDRLEDVPEDWWQAVDLSPSAEPLERVAAPKPGRIRGHVLELLGCWPPGRVLRDEFLAACAQALPIPETGARDLRRPSCARALGALVAEGALPARVSVFGDSLVFT